MSRDNNVPEKSLAIGTVLEGSHGRHRIFEDDHVYSTIDDDTEHQICDPNKKTVEQNDHTYFHIELTEEQEMVDSEAQTNGEASKEAAIAE